MAIGIDNNKLEYMITQKGWRTENISYNIETTKILQEFPSLHLNALRLVRSDTFV